MSLDLSEVPSSVTIQLDFKDVIPAQVGDILQTIRETKQNVSLMANSVKPIIGPVYQRVCSRIREWAAQVTESEIDHLILGMLLAMTLVASVIIACKVGKWKKKQLSVNGCLN